MRLSGLHGLGLSDPSQVNPSSGAASQDPLVALASGVPDIATAAAQAPAGSSVLDIINTVVQGVTLSREQSAFMDLNKQLVLQGKAPISWDQYGAQTGVGVSLSGSTQQMFYIIAGGALLVGLLAILKKR